MSLTPAEALEHVRQTVAPDSHLAVFHVTAQTDGKTCVLTGEVDSPEAKRQAIAAVQDTGYAITDQITLLPAAHLGDKTWGLCSVSVLNVREKPGNPSEMGTQIWMGNSFKVLKRETNWFLVQTSDRYLGWTEGGGFTLATPHDVAEWTNAPLFIVTVLEECIRERPDAEALPVSDVILCNLVKRIGETNGWLHVALPDGRSGYLPAKACADYAQWQKERRSTAENIERDARSFLGRPYFWGCNSPRGMDCSGFTKLVYYLNGVALDRNAAQQCNQGIEVPLNDDFAHLKKGDLLFFGHTNRVNHVGIYLGDKLFIHSSGMVHISSLDPASPLHDERRIRSLLHARRILPE